jgi:hypothetical protein
MTINPRPFLDSMTSSPNDTRLASRLVSRQHEHRKEGIIDLFRRQTPTQTAKARPPSVENDRTEKAAIGGTNYCVMSNHMGLDVRWIVRVISNSKVPVVLVLADLACFRRPY